MVNLPCNIVCVCLFLCLQSVLCQFGFFHKQEDDQRRGVSFQFPNVFDPNRIRNTLSGILHLRPEDKDTNKMFVFPFRRPGITNDYDHNHSYPNQYDKPVEFPNVPPNFGNQYNYGQIPNSYPPNTDGQYHPKYPQQPSYPEIPHDPVNFDDYKQSTTTISTIINESGDNSPSGVFQKPESPQGIPNIPPNSNIPQGIPNIPPSPNTFPEIPIKPPSSDVFTEIPNFPPNNDATSGIPNKPPSEYGSQGIPSKKPSEDAIQGIPDKKPSEDVSQGIPNKPPSEYGSQGIPNKPPIEDSSSGIPNKPPNTDSSQGIPIVPPSSDTSQGIPNTASYGGPQNPQTELPMLTPVPESQKRNNFNFGTHGIFQETCSTIDDQVGSCVSLFQCEKYLKVVQEAGSSPAAVQLLRKVHCGFDGNNPKVCCPRPGIPTGPPPSVPPPPPPTQPVTKAPTITEEPEKESEGKSFSDDFVASLPQPPVCGVSNASFSRVIGGVDAHLGDFPWMALLGYKPKRGPGARWLCGGTLVTSKHVLTAAHCIYLHEDDLFLVRLGELDLAKEDDGATPTDVLIKKKIKHEQYSSKAYTNDIGVLVLEKEVQFTDLIRPICLPASSELRERTFENYNPIITGWGATEFRGPSATHLQALQLPVVSTDSCAQAYSQYKAQKIDERVLCAGYKNGGKDACQGDSGGPLMQPIWNPSDYTTYFYQIGVVSYGKKCAEAGFPGVYSRVTYYIPWLAEKLLGTA
ncbi:uncharacterized protein LOC113511485 [Galleria mellonella]|uniref:Uncharacterized protein LOC113511485 n=1 Tax=Galleria mellonella TaxID=7137 RepID=A0ABM3N0F2_GALME|nr:uncharacterized protein LOC113511485 [Galleria mellonella]